MKVLIVESQQDLANLWGAHLGRLGHSVDLVQTADEAIRTASSTTYDAVIVNLILQKGSALGLADYLRVQQPDTNIVFVTDTTFFSDGSLFAHSGNVRAFVTSHTRPDDLAAIVEHYGRQAALAR